MNYRKLWIVFGILIPADIVMVLAHFPWVLISGMNIWFYVAVVPFPVSRQELDELSKKKDK